MAQRNQNPTNENDQNVFVLQTTQTFNPAVYNLPQFRFGHLPTSEVRNAWTGWIRGFERVMTASNIVDCSIKKIQLLAMGGLELQTVFDSIPGGDVEEADNIDPYMVAKSKLDEHFSPKHHESFERYLFWTMVADAEEPIEKFLERIQQKADKCSFGQTPMDSRQIAVMDKIIQAAPEDLRERLLERENLTLNDCVKVVNSYQAVKYQASAMSKRPHQAILNVQRLYTKANITKPEFSQNKLRCTRCGYSQHNPGERCPAYNQKCLRCGVTGHFKSVCRALSEKTNLKTGNEIPGKRFYSMGNEKRAMVFKRPRNVLNINVDEASSMYEELPVYNIGNTSDDQIRCLVGGINIQMLIDSGSKYNLIDDNTWNMMQLQNVTVKNVRFDSNKKFLAYGKVPLKLLMIFDADIQIQGVSEKLPINSTFFVIEKGQQALLGKDTAQKLGVLRIGLRNCSTDVHYADELKATFPYIKHVELTLPIDKRIAPVIQPLRRCPVPLLGKVKAKIDDLLAQDIIERIERPTTWVSPLVPILKDNGEVRLCIDMRRANQAIQRLNHPLPIFEEILSRIRNARFYSLLDMKDSYYHIMLSAECRDITTFITNWGLFRFKRLFFGVNCAPELFQSLMESLFATCSNMVGFIDDFLIYGETEEEHDRALKAVVQRIDELGIQLNHHKCKFKKTEIIFLGHKLSEKGALPSDDKIESILSCRAPKSREELRSFMGLVTYVSRFIPNLATDSCPLRDLIKSSSHFEWKQIHQIAFDRLKQRIGSIDYLGYFDPNDRTLVITDASGVGLGAVLIQFKGNLPRVISYASKSLSETEKKYPPIEKEALGIVWAVERFRIFLLGITFELETDHRPLETIFTATSRPTIRIERWLLRLQAFKFNVVYRKGSANLADSLSRLAAHCSDTSWNEESEVFIRHVMVEAIAILSDGNNNDFDDSTEIAIRAIQDAAAIDITEVIDETKIDDELKTLKDAIMSGVWKDPSLKPYAPFQSELSYVNGLLMRGRKLIVPVVLRERICMLAHEGHPGHSVMKSRLRDKYWWPNMDHAAIRVCDRCEGCRLVHAADPPEPMARRTIPEKPWVDLAIDFLGPLPTNEYVLVVIDYYSRYMELEIMSKITACETVRKLRKIFRTWGYRRTITLDNAKQFVSKEFSDFCTSIGVVLNHTTPYWPQANGEVERQNRSLLKRLKISNALYGDWKTELDDYLIQYNNSPHSTTGMTPSELLQNRKVRFKLPQIDDISTTPPSSEFRDRDIQKKFEGKERGDARRAARTSDIQTGDSVLMKNLTIQDKLTTDFGKEEYTVVGRNGPNVTVESTETGKRFDRNTSHLRKIEESNEKHFRSDDTLLTHETDKQAVLRRSSRAPKPTARFSP
ncbi:uncharacterized protein K02A2.6-like [Malaya genurostris]|uniref:uncharacterized protein K02A2.6-like n=1 Tax=Malaya genurostris TaxID=325434 RepID=UPI0026F3B355|nr:uncharacterized protein K02A2.6-like [Malaya genurostris]